MALPLSIFATPGVEAIGAFGIVGADEAGLEGYEGLEIAVVARTQE